MKIIWPRSTNNCTECKTPLVDMEKRGNYYGGKCPNCHTVVVWPLDWWQSGMKLRRGPDAA